MTTTLELSICDSCNDERLTSTGRDIMDTHDVPVLWFCFDCVRKVLS